MKYILFITILITSCSMSKEAATTTIDHRNDIVSVKKDICKDEIIDMNNYEYGSSYDYESRFSILAVEQKSMCDRKYLSYYPLECKVKIINLAELLKNSETKCCESDNDCKIVSLDDCLFCNMSVNVKYSSLLYKLSSDIKSNCLKDSCPVFTSCDDDGYNTISKCVENMCTYEIFVEKTEKILGNGF